MVDLATSSAKYFNQLAKLVDKFALVPIILFVTHIHDISDYFRNVGDILRPPRLQTPANGFLIQ